MFVSLEAWPVHVSQAPKCWDYECVPPHPGYYFLFYKHFYSSWREICLAFPWSWCLGSWPVLSFFLPTCAGAEHTCHNGNHSAYVPGLPSTGQWQLVSTICWSRVKSRSENKTKESGTKARKGQKTKTKRKKEADKVFSLSHIVQEQMPRHL